MDSLELLNWVWSFQGKGWSFLSYKNGAGWKDIPVNLSKEDLELPDDSLGDVYFCPNLFHEPRRAKNLMLPSCWLYADLDSVEPPQDSMTSSLAWESSPGRFQAMWRLNDRLSRENHSRLNRNLTYTIKADKGGWDATQVLRVPGTINHKYPKKPRVKLLRVSADTWDSTELNDINFPGWDEADESGTPSKMSGEEILKNKRQLIPKSIQSRLKAKTHNGDRSKVLWKIECGLLECGLDEGEIFNLIKGSAWNKFDNDGHLWRDIHSAAYRVRADR